MGGAGGRTARHSLAALVFAIGLPASGGGGDEGSPGAPPPSRRPRILFGGDVDTRPYEYLDPEGNPAGFNIDLMRAVARDAGVDISFRLAPWNQTLANLEAGRIDLVAMGHSALRAGRYDLIAELWTLHQVVAFLPGRQAYPQGLGELSSETVAVAERTRSHDELLTLPPALQPKLRIVPTVGETLRTLARGEATAAAANVLTLRQAAADLRIEGLVEVPILSVPYMVATQAGRGGEFTWIAARIEHLRSTGEFAALVERHLTVRSPPPTWKDYALPFIGLITLAGLVSGGAVVWNRSLHRQVAARTSELAALLGEKERLTDAMIQSEGRYRQLVESIHAILWRADARTLRFSFVSKEAEAMLGEPVQRWTEEPDFWATHVPPEDLPAVFAACAEAVACKEPREFECRMTAKDGRVVWFRGIVHVVVEHGEARELIGVMVDVTQRKGLEDQLRQSQKMEAVGRLAGGVAHDFNNLLTAISGYAELMSRKLKPEDPLRDKAGAILKATERAAALTGQLLSFSRRQVLAPRVIDLSEVVSGFDSMLRRLIGEDVRMVSAPAPGLGMVKADPGQVEQVLMNLVVNARDAMPQGGVLTIETASAELPEGLRGRTGAPPGPYVMLSVRDTGVGMDSETQSHIFEPFFTTKEQGKGTGLGLATVYGIVEQSGGHVTVETAPGEGTTVRVYLPQVGERPADADRAIVPAPDPGGSETILLVEDEDALRELAAEVLLAAGYHVLAARNGQEALTLAERHPGRIDLLLADVVMPQDGWPRAGGATAAAATGGQGPLRVRLHR